MREQRIRMGNRKQKIVLLTMATFRLTTCRSKSERVVVSKAIGLKILGDSPYDDNNLKSCGTWRRVGCE
jgi:23S rRNA-/tRNA-specific pseudouridylate synthase